MTTCATSNRELPSVDYRSSSAGGWVDPLTGERWTSPPSRTKDIGDTDVPPDARIDITIRTDETACRDERTHGELEETQDDASTHDEATARPSGEDGGRLTEDGLNCQGPHPKPYHPTGWEYIYGSDGSSDRTLPDSSFPHPNAADENATEGPDTDTHGGAPLHRAVEGSPMEDRRRVSYSDTAPVTTERDETTHPSRLAPYIRYVSPRPQHPTLEGSRPQLHREDCFVYRHPRRNPSHLCDRYVDDVDTDGPSLQALSEQVQYLADENTRLRHRIEDLESREYMADRRCHNLEAWKDHHESRLSQAESGLDNVYEFTQGLYDHTRSVDESRREQGQYLQGRLTELDRSVQEQQELSSAISKVFELASRSRFRETGLPDTSNTALPPSYTDDETIRVAEHGGPKWTYMPSVPPRYH